MGVPFRVLRVLPWIPAIVLAGAPSAAQDAQIPAGTPIVVRTTSAIDSRNAMLGAEHAAGLDEPIVVDGVTLAPRGTDAVLRIEQTEEAGRLRGRASLTLKLVALVIDGGRVAIDGSEATAESGSKGRKTAKGGVLGGVLGGAIGGILGGAGGAAKGATIGAAAGVGAVALTGQRVKVPAETRLTFTTTAPVSLETQ